MNVYLSALMVIAFFFFFGCGRDAVIFAPPAPGKLAAGIVGEPSKGISSDALGAVEYAFFYFSGVSITKYNEVNGKIIAIRIEGNAKDYTDFRDVLNKLKKDEKLVGHNIFFLDENSSDRIKL